MHGNSGTPLARKLGLKAPLTLLAIDAPPDYASWLGEFPEQLRLVAETDDPVQAAHLFVTRRPALERHLGALRNRLEQGGFVWVSWPKRASRVETDTTEDLIRAVALPLGLVDIKVCAVSDVWSGLKLVIRRSERTG